MRAIVCREFGTPEALEVTQIDDPEINANEVLVKISATGIGFVDALTVAGLYQIKPSLPFVPGSEMSGTIERIGSNVKHLSPGQRVVAMGQGGLAEYVSINAGSVIPIPDNIDFEAAASFLVNYCTALHGLDYCGRLQQGETVLVLGASGGIGTAAIDIARAMGATVIAAASTEEKRSFCLSAGADFVIDYSQLDWRKSLHEITATGKIDIVYDPVGGQYAEPALRSLAPEGRFLVVGFAAGDIPKIAINLPLLKRCSIRGVNWGAHMSDNLENANQVLSQLIRWISEEQIKPVAGHIYAMEESGQAMMAMLNRKTIGKVVIRI